ncbi:cytochrome P450 [Streptomyces sp. NPDC058045]|uniref:cytochrome P450 n=1 Tax=Streptomyces sp. NPDC058045 TaxID=3346311 RepID=UPI0036EF5E56
MPAIAPSSPIPLFDDQVLTDPYPSYRSLRELGPAVRLEEYGVWAVPHHAQLAAILRNPDLYGSEDGIALTDLANEQLLAGTVLASDGAQHVKLRRVLSKQLAPRAMKGLADRVTARAERLVRAHVESGRFDAVALSQHMVCDTVMELMGLPQADRELLLDGAAATFNVFGPDNSRYQQALPLASRMVELLHETLTREAVDRDSWMGAIFEAVDAGQIEESDAIPLASAYTAAGIDTTVLGLADCLVQLSRHPEQWQTLRGDPERWATPAFHEALRLEAPIQAFGRLTTGPTDITGVHLEKGEQLWLLYGSAGRDEAQWGPEADTFDIRRPGNDQHLAFGGGPHLCAGIPLAELQVRAVLHALATHCTTLTPDGDPTRVLNHLLRGYSSAPLTAELAPAAPESGA